MDFPTARFHWLGFPPGVLLGILLSIAQVVLQSLLFPDFAGYFLLPIILLYLLVPFFARLYTAAKADQTQNARNIGRQTGLTCAALAILTNVLLYISAGFLLGNTHFQGTGFSGFRLFFSIAAWFIGLVLLNLAGLVIALVGARFGGLIGAMLTRHTQKRSGRNMFPSSTNAWVSGTTRSLSRSWPRWWACNFSPRPASPRGCYPH
jgi:hypothetical protein